MNSVCVCVIVNVFCLIVHIFNKVKYKTSS